MIKYQRSKREPTVKQIEINPTISHLVAVSNNSVIGVDNHLPWTLKADLKHLSAYTQKKRSLWVKIRSLRLAERYRTEKIL